MNDFDPSLSDFKNTNRISHLSPFTPREIDIIACLIHGRAPKKIAVLLSLSPKTIENHIHNMMLKAECNSREGILDYVEKAGYMPLLRQHYGRLNLLAFTEEQEEIKQIPAYFQGSIKNKRMIWIISATSFLALLGGGVFLSAQLWTKKTTEFIARSDFSLPAKHVRLDRPDLISQIDMHFKERKDEIQTVALVGIGGAGKTTLARSYAHSQNISVIWEINAETPETISTSFEHLAYFLGKSSEDKKALSILQEAKNSKAREQLLVQFVKDHLKELEPWLLIYDNVPKMANIENYFPTDPQTWGKGKILITTQDGTVKNNKYVAHTIRVEELSEKEKRDLFTNILYEHNPSDKNNLKSASGFLKKIPSFPLDVSIAACYLKTTNLSFDDYLERLALPPEEFDKVQQDLLKETSEYKKTRYGIITLALQKIISAHKDFEELLLFISLLHSQNIPREWLNSYKDEITVDSFIHHLKKYSLITERIDTRSHSTSLFSIHRSIQPIFFSYFKKQLLLGKNKESLQHLTKVLQNSVAEALDQDDNEKLGRLYYHLVSLLTHSQMLAEKDRATLQSELGYIESYLLKDNVKGKKNLEEGYELASRYLEKNDPQLGKILVYLGIVCRRLGEYERARELLQTGLNIYKHHYPEDHPQIRWVLAYLGNTYRILGDTKNAKEVLEKALQHYQNSIPSNKAEYARTIAYLGVTYKDLGNYKNSAELLNQSLLIHKTHLSSAHPDITWILGYLGDTYRKLEDYKNAREVLEQGLAIHNQYYSHNANEKSWFMFLLGKVYRELREYQKAEEFLETALAYHEKQYGKEHLETAHVMRSLGQTYFLKGEMDKAEASFQEVLKIFQQQDYADQYMVLEDLADINLKKAAQKERKEDLKSSQYFKDLAKANLIEALQVTKAHFPENSPHINRIKEKLSSIK